MNSPDTSGRPPCPDLAKGTTCQECVDFLLDYIDGLLAGEERFKFESHIAFCRDCETYLDNYRKAAALAAAAGREAQRSAAQDVPAALVDAILKARKRDHN